MTDLQSNARPILPTSQAAPTPSSSPSASVPAPAPGGSRIAAGTSGEPTTLLAVREARPESKTHVTSAELRERDAVVRAGLWGVGLSTLAVLVISALMGLMRGA